MSSVLWRYDGRSFIKVSQQGAYAIIQDRKGNIWTTGSITGKGWALSRYDAETLYKENPTITEIMSIQEGALLGLLEASDGSIWFGAMGPGSKVYRYDGETITDFNDKEGP